MSNDPNGEFSKHAPHAHFSDEPERMTSSDTGGNKAEKDLQLGALDPRALMEVARVGGVGARKYARYNFAKGHAWSLSYDAAQRHAHAFWDRVDRDRATGLLHAAQTAWHWLTLVTFQIRGIGVDDRFPTTPSLSRDETIAPPTDGDEIKILGVVGTTVRLKPGEKVRLVHTPDGWAVEPNDGVPFTETAG